MFATIRFLREHNPTAGRMTELDILNDIERTMIQCAKDEEMIYCGTMGYMVLKVDDEDGVTDFEIMVDPGICMGYESVTIEC